MLLFVLGLLHNQFLQLGFYRPPLGFDSRRAHRRRAAAHRHLLRRGGPHRPAHRVRARPPSPRRLLLGYWALLAFVPAPGSAAGDYSLRGNLAGYVDSHYLPGKILEPYYGYGDNEGLLSTIPAVATALLGVLAGPLAAFGPARARKALGLAAAGAVCLLLGWAWGPWFPIIKNLWTSSFVLFAGGWSLLLLALFYGVIDVLGFRAWAFFFVVIGANAITIYLLPQVIDFEKVGQLFLRRRGEARGRLRARGGGARGTDGGMALAPVPLPPAAVPARLSGCHGVFPGSLQASHSPAHSPPHRRPSGFSRPTGAAGGAD